MNSTMGSRTDEAQDDDHVHGHDECWEQRSDVNSSRVPIVSFKSPDMPLSKRWRNMRHSNRALTQNFFAGSTSNSTIVSYGLLSVRR